MLQRLYRWTLRAAAHPRATAWLALVAFLESSVFPIPPDVMIVPMALARPERALRIAAVATAASVLGGLFGYAIGYFLFESVGRPVIALYGYEAEFALMQAWYREYGLWVVMILGFTPMPYKVATIASGVLAFDPLLFLLGSLLSRGARFYLVAGLLRWFGEPLRAFIERRLNWLATGFVLLLLGGFLALSWV